MQTKNAKSFTILVPKETRAGELRVALIPSDVQELIKKDHKIYVEHDAGKGAGFSDQDYLNAGAVIRKLDDNTIDAYKKYLDGINLIVRAKRPERAREVLENSTIAAGTIMIGAFDPLEKHSSHIDEYHRANIIAYSIDQTKLTHDDPLNLLAAMSKIAGRLALLDAMSKSQLPIKKVVIIGFGTAGQSAYAEALKQKLATTVILTNPADAKQIEANGSAVVLLDKLADLKRQQDMVKNVLLDADIIIATARKPNSPAPLLIPKNTLQLMQSGAVVVDMALSEGGNVEGSEHDATHIVGNGVIVTNVSGYPKAAPHESSKIWSRVSLGYILAIAADSKLPLLPC